MQYCENCGKEVNSNAKFCKNCGAPQTPQITPAQSTPSKSVEQVQVAVLTPQPQIQTPQIQTPPPTPPAPIAQPAQHVKTQAQQDTSERVVGVIVLRRPKSLGRYDSYTGVVTSQRIIFAQMTGDMVKQAVQQARDQAKAEGKGFFGQWQEQLRASFGYAQRYLTMPPAAIGSETPGNYAVDNSTVREVKIKHKEIRSGGDVQSREFEMEVHSANGKVEFKMDERNEYVELLKSVYGDRVKMPFGYFSKTINIKF